MMKQPLSVTIMLIRAFWVARGQITSVSCQFKSNYIFCWKSSSFAVWNFNISISCDFNASGEWWQIQEGKNNSNSRGGDKERSKNARTSSTYAGWTRLQEIVKTSIFYEWKIVEGEKKEREQKKHQHYAFIRLHHHCWQISRGKLKVNIGKGNKIHETSLLIMFHISLKMRKIGV